MWWRVFVLGSVIIGIGSGQDCIGQWQSYATCLRKQQQQVLTQAGLSPPSRSEQSQLESSVRNCFSRNGCRDPIVPDDENRARMDCYHRSQQKLRSDMQDCVRSEIRGFVLPEDNFGNGDTWSIFLKQLNDAVRNYQNYCQRGRSGNSNSLQRDLRVCVEQSLSDFARRRAPGGGSSQNPRFALRSNQQGGRGFCAMRAQCVSSRNSANDGMSESCESEWNGRAVPRLCSCAQQLRSQGRVNSYESQYSSCMSSKGFRQTDRQRDPAIGWLEKGLNTWCPRNGRQGNSNPCSSSSGNSGNFGGGGNNGNGNGNGNNGGGWSGSGNQGGPNNWGSQSTTHSFFFNKFTSTTQGPNWNGGGDGSNGNWNGGSNWNGNGGSNWNGNSGGDGSNGNWDGGDQQSTWGPDQSFTNGPPPSNGQTGGGLAGLFGGNGGGLGSLFGGGLGGGADQSGGSGDLFGGMLNNLGIGNPLDNGSLLSQVAGFGQAFQGLLGGGGRKR